MSSIKKIVLEVGGVELSLTPEDAKTLQAALNELFQKKEIQYVPSPYPTVTVTPRPWRWYEYGPVYSLLSTTTSAGSSTGGTTTALNLSGSSYRSLKQ